MKNLVFFGMGGMAREVHQLVEDINAASPSLNILGFLDENRDNHGQLIHGFPLLGGIEWLNSVTAKGVFVVVCIGDAAARRKVVKKIEQETDAQFLSLVHPNAWVGNRVRIGEGTVICAGCLITTDIVIGNHVIVNIGSTISHDAVIDDFVTIAPMVKITGAVHVGQGVDLGAGTSILQGKVLGEWSIVGAGTIVINDIEANVTVVGSPARVIKSRQAGWHLV